MGDLANELNLNGEIKAGNKEFKNLRKLLTKDFKNFTHGYVTTSHSSQGKTTQHIVVAGSRVDNKTAYVSISRGKQSVGLHMPDKQIFRNSLKNEGNRLSALDIFKESTKEIINKITNSKQAKAVKNYFDFHHVRKLRERAKYLQKRNTLCKQLELIR